MIARLALAAALAGSALGAAVVLADVPRPRRRPCRSSRRASGRHPRRRRRAVDMVTRDVRIAAQVRRPPTAVHPGSSSASPRRCHVAGFRASASRWGACRAGGSGWIDAGGKFTALRRRPARPVGDVRADRQPAAADGHVGGAPDDDRAAARRHAAAAGHRHVGAHRRRGPRRRPRARAGPRGRRRPGRSSPSSAARARAEG